MTITGTPPTKPVSSPPPVRPQRGVVAAAAAGLIVVAAVSITPWLLPTASTPESNSIRPTSAVASTSEAAASGQANAGRNSGSIAGPSAYVMFCQNSPSLCVPPTPTLANGYVKFCGNSPTLCVLPKRN
jgi:hypothetical protein